MKNLKTIALAALLSLTCAYANPKYSAKDFPSHQGVVQEVMQTPGYSYIKVEEKGKSFWIATTKTPVAKGAKIRFTEQIWMQNFHSKALNRDFDKILFAAGLTIDDVKGTAVYKSAVKTKELSTPVKKVAKLKDGQSIAEIFEKKDTLKGKTVKVRGEVVKVSRNIMGKNWVHIKDGSSFNGKDKIIFRSPTEDAKVGDIVVAQGQVETNIDFGYGYSYEVLVEKSRFTK